MIEIKVRGLEIVRRGFTNIQRAVSDRRAFFREDALPLLQRAVQRIFTSEGRGRWQPLQASTIRSKGHARPLVRSARLRRSLTQSGHPDMIVEIGNTTLTFGTSVPYASYHEEGTRRIPARPFLAPLGTDSRFAQQLADSYDMRIQRVINRS